MKRLKTGTAAGTVLMGLTLFGMTVYGAPVRSSPKKAESPLPFLIGLGVFLLIAGGAALTVIILRHRKKRREELAIKNAPIRLPSCDMVPKNYTELISAEVRKHDPDFSGAKFCDWVKNVFIRVLESISDRHPQELRSLETDDLCRSHEREIHDLLSLGQKDVYEHIVINRAYLQLYVRRGASEQMTVYLHGTMQCYKANAVTGEPLPRYDTGRQEFKYLLTFRRHVGAKTIIVNGIQAMVCQNCGAPVENVSDIRCRYCDSELRNCENNWILSEMTPMSQDTLVDDSGVSVTD